jgi:hypothetical protein
MATELSVQQKLNLLRGGKELSHSEIAAIAEIVFGETGEFWAIGDFLDSLLEETPEKEANITVPRWVLRGAFDGISELVHLQLKQSKGGGRYAKANARRKADRIHLIRTIKLLNRIDEGHTREEAYAMVAEESEGTPFESKEDAVKKSVFTVEEHLASEDPRYYLPLSNKLRKLFGDMGEFDGYADWPEGN